MSFSSLELPEFGSERIIPRVIIPRVVQRNDWVIVTPIPPPIVLNNYGENALMVALKTSVSLVNPHWLFLETTSSEELARQNSKGETALMMAIRYRRLIAKEILKKMNSKDLELRDIDGDNALTIALCVNNSIAIEIMKKQSSFSAGK